jgi:flagellar basal body-associated protein FliL
MGKIVLFWILGVLTIFLFVGGGAWLFFWSYAKAKKNKMF